MANLIALYHINLHPRFTEVSVRRPDEIDELIDKAVLGDTIHCLPFSDFSHLGTEDQTDTLFSVLEAQTKSGNCVRV